MLADPGCSALGATYRATAHGGNTASFSAMLTLSSWKDEAEIELEFGTRCSVSAEVVGNSAEVISSTRSSSRLGTLLIRTKKQARFSSAV